VVNAVIEVCFNILCLFLHFKFFFVNALLAEKSVEVRRLSRGWR